MIEMAIITLITDFGLADGYPGIMKGVIYSISPSARIADITHLISPQNIREGAVALFRSYRYFPPGSIHVAVIDPGVGTNRRPIALQLGNHYFVGPDNGLFSLVVQEAVSNRIDCHYVVLNNEKYWLPSPSNVFHGRDIFAPVAAHLSLGVSLDQFGDTTNDLIRMDFPKPTRTENCMEGEVITIDHFGNLSTNILDMDLQDTQNIQVVIAGHMIQGLVRTFGEGQTGRLAAMIGTDHELMISIINGNAQEKLDVAAGEKIQVIFGIQT